MASIDKRADGRWRARWREYPGGPQKSQHFPRKTDAQALLDEISGAQRSGTYVDPKAGRVTFAEWWDLWRPGRHDLNESSSERDDGYYRVRILEAIGPVPLSHIDRPLLRAWVTGMVDGGLAATTVRHTFGLVRQALDAAVEERLLGANPAIRFRGLPKIVAPEMQIASPDDMATLGSVIAEGWKTWVLTAGYTGLRLGELSALRRGRVDLVGRRIHVLESVTEVNGRNVFGAPKTKAGRRSVPIPEPIAELLEQQCDGLDRDDLVFTSTRGDVIRRSKVRQQIWLPATVAAGLGTITKTPIPKTKPQKYATHYDGLRIHDLRHTAVSFWIQEGANIKQLTTWAGHSSAATLIDRYGHLFDDNEKSVMDSLGTTIRGATPRPLATVTKIA